MTSVAIPRRALMGGLIWLGAAAALGLTGALAALRPPGPQLLILGLTIAALVATHTGPLRAWVDALPTRLLVGIHGIRFIGAVFLILAAQGAVSQVFATRAGWGDIAAASLALLLVSIGPPSTAPRRWAYLAWNAFAMGDLLLAVGTATAVVLRGDVPAIEPLLRLPLIVVPTFLVPLLLTSHVILFRRLLGASPTNDR